MSARARSSRPHAAPAIRVTQKVLRSLPLPVHDKGDKNERGRVLVVGGAAEMPGAVLLAAEGALRAGAGKLQIATVRSVAPWVGAAIPESRVFSLPETRRGSISPAAAPHLIELAAKVDAMVIGPGMIDQDAVDKLVERLLPRLSCKAVIDAAALYSLRRLDGYQPDPERPLVLTPNTHEFAHMTDVDLRDGHDGERLDAAREVARRFGAIVVVKGPGTLTVAPRGPAYRNMSGNVGLATSGSGDTLAGVIAGLAARGAQPLHAAVWGVFAHGKAADRLARRVGPVGFLARELLGEIPCVLAAS